MVAAYSQNVSHLAGVVVLTLMELAVSLWLLTTGVDTARVMVFMGLPLSPVDVSMDCVISESPMSSNTELTAIALRCHMLALIVVIWVIPLSLVARDTMQVCASAGRCVQLLSSCRHTWKHA